MAKIGIDVRLWGETGIGRYIRNLVSGLLDLDSENQYVLFCRPEDIEDIKFLIFNDKFLIMPTDIRWHSVKEQLEFPRLLNKYNLDLVHFPYFSVPVFYNKPFVVTVHALIINHFPTGRATSLPFPLYRVKRFGYEFILKKAIHDAKKIITPSESTKKEIIDHYKTSKSKIVVTPEGIDDGISGFKASIFNPKEKYFLYVGNAYPHKNLEKMLEAFKLFMVNGSPRENSGQAQFTVKLGGKEDYFYKRLKHFVKKNNIHSVEFLGFVSDEELSRLYSQAVATFVPSLMEGFGLTALEAMKMGSLVACSKISSLEEVCGRFAEYFDPSDILSMVKAMEDINSINKEEKKERINEAKKHVEKYSWQKTAKLTIEVYNSILE